MGELGEPDQEDSNKTEEYKKENTPPPSYNSWVEPGKSSNDKKINIENKTADIDNVSNSGKKKNGKKNEDTEEKEKGSADPPPVGLIELVNPFYFFLFRPTLLLHLFQFRFSTPLDTFLIIFGVTLAFSCGSAMPILCILFGDTLQVHMFFLFTGVIVVL